MDVNGTRFHFVIGQDDWQPLLESADEADLDWHPSLDAVGLAARLPRFPRQLQEPRLTVHNRRGADRDRYGSFYWIGSDQQTIWIRPRGEDAAGVFWSIADLSRACDLPTHSGDFQPVGDASLKGPSTLRGLAVSHHHYLVAGTLEPAGLVIFDLHAGGPACWWPWPDQVPFAPFDMCRSADGGFWILDRGPLPAQARIWKLNRRLSVAPLSSERIVLEHAHEGDFGPPDGVPRRWPSREFPVGVELGFASPLKVVNPVAIAALPDDSLLVLDSEAGSTYSRIHRFRGAELNDEFSLEGVLVKVLQPPFDPVTADVHGHDFAFLNLTQEASERGTGRLLVVGDDGNQAFSFRFDWDMDTMALELERRYFPLRRFSGKALISDDEVYFDFDQQWLPLVEQPRRRFAASASLAGLVFDGKQPDCVWHRVTFDACIPKGSYLGVRSRAAEQRELLATVAWREEPVPYLRKIGSELPRHQPFAVDACSEDGIGTWELLLQTARGRFLELELTFHGNGRTSPMVRGLRVYYPRFSYLSEYLPAVYREDAESAGFVERFLANLEGMYATFEGRIEQSESWFDSRTAPKEFLDWLAGWLGAVLDPTWDERRRRLFLAHAHRLYQWRGTTAGLRATIRLAIEACPDERLFAELQSSASRYERSFGYSVRVVEQFLRRGYPGVALGDATEYELPASLPSGSPWEPALGADALHQRFRTFLQHRYNANNEEELPAILNEAWAMTFDSPEAIRLSPLVPDRSQPAADWLLFTQGPIGFTYSPVTTDDAERYLRFLGQRYQRIRRLNEAYELAGDEQLSAFTEVTLPGKIPPAGQPLVDWIQFVSLIWPIHRHAHRFRVLVPIRPEESGLVQQQRLSQVAEIVRREKPAHTEAEVAPYWALFQIGNARLGRDTVLGEGGRYTALVLGASRLTESYLSASHPGNVRDRYVLGRDPVAGANT